MPKPLIGNLKNAAFGIEFAGKRRFERVFLANLIRDSLSSNGFGEGSDAATGTTRDG